MIMRASAKKLLSLGAVVVAVVFGSAMGKKPPATRVELGDTKLNEELSRLPFGNERTLTRAATFQYDLPALVGHAIFMTKNKDGACAVVSDQYDAIFVSPESYVKSGTKLEPKTVNAVMYDRKVNKGAAYALQIFPFSAQLTNDTLAQVTITDAAFLTIPDGGLDSAWKRRIVADASPTGCPALLVRGAKVRVASYRFFTRKEAQAGGTVQAVFGANGKTYSESSMAQNDIAIAIDPSIIHVGPNNPDTSMTVAPNSPEVPKTIAIPEKGVLPLTPDMRQRLLRPAGF